MYLPIACALISFGIADTTPDVAAGVNTEALGSAPLIETDVAGVKPWISAEPLDTSDFGSGEVGNRNFDNRNFGKVDFRRRDSAENSVDARVRDLVRRQLQAGRWLYGAQRLAELEARGTLLIEWLDQGRFPAPEQVEQLTEHVNQLEEQVTERLARDYRIAVYNTFRTDREEFNHRRARWKLIDERWTKSEHTVQRRANLNQWLAEAIEVSQPDSITPLPPPPAWYFEPDDALAQQNESRHIDTTPAEEADHMDPFDESSPDDLVDSTPLLDAPAGDLVPQRRPDDVLTEPETTDSLVPADTTPTNDTTPESDRFLLGPSSVRGGPTVEALPDDVDSVSRVPVPESLTKRGRNEQPSTSAPADDAPVDLTDLVDDEPAEQQQEKAVVNIDLLAARVAGHNLAVVELSEQLRERNRWRAASLAPQVDRLIELHERRKDLVVFLELLRPQQRRQFEEVETTKQVVTLLAEKIVGVRLWTMGDAFDGSSQQRQEELAALAEFSRRLAEIAFDSPGPADVEIR